MPNSPAAAGYRTQFMYCDMFENVTPITIEINYIDNTIDG